MQVRRNILIADDNQDALESLALMLRLEGHEVHCASDGEEALALAGLRKPEIVVLDVGMPKLDGCEVARRIRAESWGRERRAGGAHGLGPGRRPPDVRARRDSTCTW